VLGTVQLQEARMPGVVQVDPTVRDPGLHSGRALITYSAGWRLFVFTPAGILT
jgi:hypothetical protein